MNREDLQKILKEVDILLLLAERGRMEARFFAWHMFVWGSYVGFNMLWDILSRFISLPLQGIHWFHTLFLAFFFATLPESGFLRSLFWIGVYMITLGVYLATHSSIWTVGVLVFMLVLVSFAVYVPKDRERRGNTRPTLFGYIGMFWGMMFGSFWWAISLFPEARTMPVFLLWITHVFGGGLLASVVLHPGFFLTGLLLIFLGPVLLKLGVVYLLGGYALAGWAMAGLGLRMYRHDS